MIILIISNVYSLYWIIYEGENAPFLMDMSHMGIILYDNRKKKGVRNFRTFTVYRVQEGGIVKCKSYF